MIVLKEMKCESDEKEKGLVQPPSLNLEGFLAVAWLPES